MAESNVITPTRRNAIYIGTELKFALIIETEGFDMATDDFCVVVKSARKKVEIKKDEMLIDAEERYLFTVDTAALGVGDYWVYAYAYVPDADFPDGLRTEVQKLKLCTVMS